MKIPSSFLHDLVKQLTKSEKRYVKIQAGSGEKDYIRLMDALLAQDVYDEDKLIRDNEGANFLKHLAVNKRYLYELLLKLLAGYGQRSLEEKVQSKINAAKVLIAKGLPKAAWSELKKGKKLATQYELFALQLLLFSVEKGLVSGQVSSKQNNQQIDQLFEAEGSCLKQLQNTNEYWYLAKQVAQFQLRFKKAQTEEQRRQILELSQSPLLLDLSLASNFKSKLYFYQANASCQFMLGAVERAYTFNKGFLNTLESNPHFFKLYAERYLATLNNMLIDSLVVGKYDLLEEGLERLVKTTELPAFKSVKNIQARVFRQRYLLLLNWSLSQKDFEKALDWIPEIAIGLEQFGDKIEKPHRISFYYLMAYLLFQNGDYDQALQWNNHILNDKKEDVVKEIYHFARILNLLIHYELGNYTLLGSLLLSTPKYLKVRRAIYATEKTLFRLLSKLLNAASKAEQEELLVTFKTIIEAHRNTPSERMVFNYLDLLYWLKGKV